MGVMQIGHAGGPLVRAILLVGTFFVGSGTARGEALSIKHLFTVREAARDEGLERPASIAVDTLRGEVYVSDRMRKEILIYDEEGRFLQKIGGQSGIQIPSCLAVTPSGTLVVGEKTFPVLAFLEMGGNRPAKIDLKLDGSTDILSGGISVRSDDEIFLVERFGTRVIRVNRKTGSVERFFPVAAGTAPKGIEFQDVIATPDRGVIGLSSKGRAVYILDERGEIVKRFGEHGSRAENVSFPTAAALGPKGAIWIVDSFQHSIKVFRQDGSFCGEFGEMGTDDGKFFFPIDIAFGKGSRFFVLEKGVPRFQAFQLLHPVGNGSR